MLRVSEIFHSLQGETSRVGLPTVFVRLTGCPLRCTWCDTEYAFSGGDSLELADVMQRVSSFGCRTVCVTGGEPLAQKGAADLLAALCDAGYSVSLETSGALDIGGVDARVSRIVDLKAPGSGEEAKNRWENLDLLTSHDEVKFVLASREDYDWGRGGVSPAPTLRALPGAVRAGPRPARSGAAGAMAARRPPAGALPVAIAQALVGQRPGALSPAAKPAASGKMVASPKLPSY